ncbi:SDR family NAD(P)-dependent oxidoreductase [Amycolatopsis sp.]|uniref:SDR family NAD(P)-dependent oxidoreductase n=1 Tax=Amycolatopsis sp. TaxID=37632 RepID=UPI002B60D789|nr:SDR family NAD(P)-dependent oxidoreductase [Amycolatopsis sp.]HVV11779.1 SDR family NAD(P)-dependent oxidoreductase [Amycolatopsis sp.]
MSNINGASVLITGANRGIGRALVDEALQRGARRVYAGTRVDLSHSDERVVPVTLDVTDPAQIQRAVTEIESLDVLVNNAGIALYDDLSDRTVLERHFAVNVHGTNDVIHASLPLLVRAQGSVVNILSVNALAPLPMIPSYSISKAAAFNLTQSLRLLLAPQGVTVHAVLTGPVDTDMSRGLDIPKASPESVAKAVFDGVERGEAEIFPDSLSAMLRESWNAGASKALEAQYAEMVANVPAEA